MRSSSIPLVVAAFTTSIAAAGFVPAVSFSDLDEWRSAAGLPGGSDPSANLFSSWSTSERIENFSSVTTSGVGVPYVSVSNGTSANWWQWTATSGSPVGGVSIGSGPGTGDNADGQYIYSTPTGNALVFSFTGANNSEGGFRSGLRGIGGGFRFFSASGAPVSGRLILTISNGDSVVRNFNSADAFAGFWLTDEHTVITSLRLEPFGNTMGSYFIGAHTLYLGYAGTPIPAPGAVALLGAAGLIGVTRRRG